MEKVYKIKLPKREKTEERLLKRDPVYRVIASDRDEGPNAEISYSIEDGDEEGKFFIEPKTGLVSAKMPSNPEVYDILTVRTCSLIYKIQFHPYFFNQIIFITNKLAFSCNV